MIHESYIGCYWVFVLLTCVLFGVKDRTGMHTTTSLNYFQMNVITYMNTYYRTM